MFCVPATLWLYITKMKLDYDLDELLPSNIMEILEKQAQKQIMPHQLSLNIDTSNQFTTKVSYSSQATYNLQVCEKQQKIIMVGANAQNEERLWRLLRKQQFHKLQIGDVIRVGTTQFSVYSASPKSKSIINKGNDSNNDNKFVCRFCLQSGETENDPLLSVCCCIGSVKYIHLDCLRNWMAMKCQKQQRGQITVCVYQSVYFRFQNIKCEICKVKYPEKSIKNGRTYPLRDMGQEGEYITLRTQSLDQDGNEIILYFRIELSSPVLFGDEEEGAQLGVYSFGVSPAHCRIFFQNDDIWIQDCGSKMGTLVTLHGQQFFSNKKGIVLQHHDIVMHIKRQTSFLDCLIPQEKYILKFQREKPKQVVK